MSSYASAAYRELGATLRRIREQAGITGNELAIRLGLPPTTISRMETGRRVSTTTDVIQYVMPCGMTFGAAQPLIEFTRLAERRQGYHLSDQSIGGSLQSLIFHESIAETSVIYEPQVVHGLLQTPEYARAMVTAVNSDFTEDQVDGVVRTRMERSRVLALPEPARFTFFLHENALRLPVLPAEVMSEQLLHLVLVASSDNVSVRVVPSGFGGRSTFGGAFHLMEFRQYSPIAYLDNLGGGGLILDEPAYVQSYYELMIRLDDVALDEGQSRVFVADLADEYDRGSQPDGTDAMAQEQLQRGIGVELCRGRVVGPSGAGP
ncbi:transcriptional regulator with XRE-family HTH domain [Actinokineospora baliensis]|uniref:helix-turn-helix domain-containing protein n=1 Tax=Actinokineospora baliensis TaxID=547056 RepID=UPI001EF8CCA3|nr:helix-turn-helix transcriptional regulator [Actinokineospora baliensis]MBM7774344.1 transcriptional regulator with XRE-family HTH domain [Actinokineospora baliensis]